MTVTTKQRTKKKGGSAVALLVVLAAMGGAGAWYMTSGRGGDAAGEQPGASTTILVPTTAATGVSTAAPATSVPVPSVPAPSDTGPVNLGFAASTPEMVQTETALDQQLTVRAWIIGTGPTAVEVTLYQMPRSTPRGTAGRPMDELMKSMVARASGRVDSYGEIITTTDDPVTHRIYSIGLPPPDADQGNVAFISVVGHSFHYDAFVVTIMSHGPDNQVALQAVIDSITFSE